MDLEKAYDRVDWAFFKEILQAVGFTPKWPNSFCFVFNRRSCTSYGMEKNLRNLLSERTKARGFPSPLPFYPLYGDVEPKNLEGDRFRTIKIKETFKKWPGSVEHLLCGWPHFLWRGVILQSQTMQQILASFCDMRGQKVNINKSKLFLSKNTDIQTGEILHF